MVIASSARPGILFDFAAKPAVTLHALEQRVQGPRADLIAVATQLRDHPLADNGVFGGVMQDVDLPKTEKDFAGQQLAIDGRHAPPLYGWVVAQRKASLLPPSSVRFSDHQIPPSVSTGRERDGATNDTRGTLGGAEPALPTLQERIMRVVASLVVGVLVVGLQTARVESQGKAAGYVKIVMGTAFILRSGGEAPARPGDAVYQDDGLRTGVDGRLGVTLKDNTRISLGSNSEILLSQFTFAPAEGQLALVLKLLRGSAEFVSGRIAGLRPETVRIETPHTIVGVRGTHLAIRTEGP